MSDEIGPASLERIPTVVSVDHVGFSVPDLDQAIAFFEHVLGCTVLETAGPRPYKGDPATSVRVAMLRYDASHVFELLEWHLPGQNDYRPVMTDPGGYHLALTVQDLDAAIAYLVDAPGVWVAAPDQLSGGRRRTFFTTPWGMWMQLITPAVGRIF